ncbi:hypothetical protein, partial [Ralstonia pseudosolanacearum]|uniref:hypothetical protein n=1 Tax=Ralstonia pseudosolanacearum TaxID=1310165 RepID=UPI00352598A1
MIIADSSFSYCSLKADKNPIWIVRAFPRFENSLAITMPAWETLINGVREWNREPSCSRFPHRGKEVPIEHVFRRFRVVPGAL